MAVQVNFEVLSSGFCKFSAFTHKNVTLQACYLPLKSLLFSFFRPDDAISHLTVCNNFLVMAMTNGVIMRLDLEHADEPDSKFVSFTVNVLKFRTLFSICSQIKC